MSCLIITKQNCSATGGRKELIAGVLWLDHGNTADWEHFTWRSHVNQVCWMMQVE